MKIFSRRQTKQWLLSHDRRVSSASVVACTEQGDVLVVKAGYKPYWSFPGGVIDAGETPAVAAVRELAEETGVVVSPDELTFRMVVDRVSDIAQTYQFIFEVNVDASMLTNLTLDSHEIEAADIVTREQILSGDRYYSESTVRWARGDFGYHEQVFAPRDPQISS